MPLPCLIERREHEYCGVVVAYFLSSGDVPMQKVKFNVNTEYAYLQNFKILTCTVSLSLSVFFSTYFLPFGLVKKSLTFGSFSPEKFPFRGCCIVVV